ncbi:N-acetylmuramoyl-L-alanine amidase [Pseudarthrobacter sp. BRE9]|uniref:N-acetylmuramoyl-L-alanine amidase n=1 Tax=Pseudarthrobacter sp. BRE9 TaxID=2962582 RepID=UPI0028819C4E|nr:hypothetical protein [Pseudarthrobacter sp. BRE9]MDT0171013.1 hypothetical protein [Pseudarthrobacter sp. BRE9]
MSYLLDYNPGTQQWGYPRRGGAQLSGTIIVHTAECAADNVGEDTSAEGCANMIANRADWGSYHRLVDSDSILDMLPWEYEAWQDTETNNWAVGISAALRTSDWLTMPADRRDRVYRNLAACAADFVQYMAGKGVTVPLVRITGAQARARVPGFCAHGDSGIARTDPGAAFDWALFFRYTAEALAGGTIQLQSTTVIEEDIMASIEDLANVLKRDDVLEEIARRIHTRPVPYFDPVTGQDTGTGTTLAVLAGASDFQHAATRRTLAEAAGAIVDAVKAAQPQDAANVAQAAYDEFVKKLDATTIKVSAK